MGWLEVIMSRSLARGVGLITVIWESESSVRHSIPIKVVRVFGFIIPSRYVGTMKAIIHDIFYARSSLRSQQW